MTRRAPTPPPDRVALAGREWRWVERDPRVLGRPSDWVHPGLAVTPDGIACYDERRRELVILDADRRPVRRLPTPARSGHGIAAVGAGAALRYWVTDPGYHERLVAGTVRFRPQPGFVTVLDAGGTVLAMHGAPDLAAYREAVYRPSSVVPERPDDPASPVWVADGYGAYLIHRLAPSGERLATIAGTPDGPFDCPHAVFVDRRGPEPTLLVADRGHAAIHRFDLDGRFVGTFGRGIVTSPSAFALLGDLLLVAELHGALTVLDDAGGLVGTYGDASIVAEPGWPDLVEGERTVRRPIERGRLSAPHAVVVDGDRRILVAEWRFGGRLVELVADEQGRPAI